jgi:hypothetical protein
MSETSFDLSGMMAEFVKILKRARQMTILRLHSAQVLSLESGRGAGMQVHVLWFLVVDSTDS